MYKIVFSSETIIIIAIINQLYRFEKIEGDITNFKTNVKSVVIKNFWPPLKMLSFLKKKIRKARKKVCYHFDLSIR